MSLKNDYTKSFPLDIRLLNEDQQNILYISDELQTLSIEMINVSDEAVQFNLPSEGESADEFYHINVYFKPDTLDTSASPNDIFSIDNTDGWVMGTQNIGDNNSITVAFQFSKELTLQPKEKTTILLSNVVASGTVGSRVTQVQVSTENLCYETDASNQIPFTFTTQLSIINQRGKKNIPLHFGFYGSNTVLNEGITPSDLVLQITNTAAFNQLTPNASNVNFNYNSNSSKRSNIKFSFISDETGLEDALGTANQISAIEIDPISGWDCPKDILSTNTEWNLYPNSESQILASGNALTINIKGIISGAPTGITYLKISYSNIPGYWDGDVMVPIMKQPLVTRSVIEYDANNKVIAVGNQVGIGVMPSKAKHTVDGLECPTNNLHVGGHIISKQRISDKTGPVMPVGGIIMWGGFVEQIPDGWNLCDGTNGTPNLTDRFILGAGKGYNPGDKGGNEEILIKEENLPSHNHGVTLANSGTHSHELIVDTGSDGDLGQPYDMITVDGYSNYVGNEAAQNSEAGDHNHEVTQNNVGGDTAIDIRPQYFALCFIMKQ